MSKHYDKLKELQDKFSWYFLGKKLTGFKLVFTGSFILDWFGILDRKVKDIDVILYVKDEDYELAQDIMTEDFGDENNAVVEGNNMYGGETDSEDDCGDVMYKIDLYGDKIDLFIHKLSGLDDEPEDFLEFGDVSVSSLCQIFKYKYKYNKQKTNSDIFSIMKILGDCANA